MKTFDSLLGAAEYAVTLCRAFRFFTSDERYDADGLLAIAEISDSENPADEDSFYVVAPSGAIGFCGDGGDIDWLFVTEANPNEDLPISFQASAQINFCPKCGASVIPGSRFCGACGNML